MSRFLDRRLEKLVPYTPGEQLPALVKLNTNENPFPPSPHACALLNAAAAAQLRLYPDPQATTLRKAAAQLYGVQMNQVVAGNGSDELLAFTFTAFGGQGIAYPTPSYSFYGVFAALYQVEGHPIPLRDDFTLDVGDYADFPGTVIIANPNAPTGLSLDKRDIIRLVEQNRQRLVVIDEAYADFNSYSCLDLLAAYDNLLLIRTLSKSYSLAGARCGLALSSPEVAADMELIRNSFNPYNVNSLTQALATAALLDQDYFCSCREQTIAQRTIIINALRELGFIVLDSATNFIMAGAHPRIGGERLYQELRQRGILVRFFSPERLQPYVRISIGSAEDNRLLINAVREILNSTEGIQ